MKKIFVLFLLAALVAIPSLAMAEDSKEILILKRAFAQERVLRLTAELELMKNQIQKWQEGLEDAKTALKALNSQLEDLESAADEKRQENTR